MIHTGIGCQNGSFQLETFVIVQTLWRKDETHGLTELSHFVCMPKSIKEFFTDQSDFNLQHSVHYSINYKNEIKNDL